MNEFPISNLRAKYADKLTEGSPDKQAIEQSTLLASIPVLTNDNAGDILKTAPKEIQYSGLVYQLQDITERPECIYYSSNYGEQSLTLSISHTQDEYIIDADAIDLANAENVTNLYRHEISFDLAPYVPAYPIVVTRVSDSHTWNVDSIPNVKLTLITPDVNSYPNVGSLNSVLLIGLYNSINSIRLEDNPVENCSVSYYAEQFRGSGYLQNMFKLKSVTDGYTVSYSGPGVGPVSATWSDTVTPL